MIVCYYLCYKRSTKHGQMPDFPPALVLVFTLNFHHVLSPSPTGIVLSSFLSYLIQVLLLSSSILESLSLEVVQLAPMLLQLLQGKVYK